MKNISIIAALCLTIGFASGWLLKPSPENESTNNNNTNSEKPARSTSRTMASTNNTGIEKQRSAKRSGVSVRHASSVEEMDPEMRKAIEESQKQQTDMIRKRIGDKFELRITAMVKELGLNADQEKSLREFYDEQLKKINITDMAEFMTETDHMSQIAAAMRGDDLNARMENIFTEEQKKELEAMQVRKKNSQIEAHAMKDLAKLQQTIDLSEDQKQKVYNLMIEDAEKSIKSQSDADYVTRTMMSAMGVEMDLGDMDMGMMMSLNAKDENTATSKAELVKKLKDDRKKKIDAKVERLAPVLNETQQEQYRKSLENKGGMFNMMLQGMEASELEANEK